MTPPDVPGAARAAGAGTAASGNAAHGSAAPDDAAYGNAAHGSAALDDAAYGNVARGSAAPDDAAHGDAAPGGGAAAAARAAGAHERRQRLDGLALALILVCCTIWGLNQVVVKTTLPAMPPLLQAGVRSVLAATLLWLFAAWRGIPLLLRDGAGWPGGVAAGVLFGLEFVCVYLGLQYTTASRLVVFLYLAPFVVAVGMPFISRAERLSRAQVAGLTAAFGSVAFAFQEGFSASVPNQWLGDLLAVLAGLLWGATTLVVRATRLSTASPERTLFYQLAVSAPVLLGGALLSGESMAWPPPGWALASIAFQSVVVAFASFLGWFWMLRHYPATKVSSFTFLTPVFGLGFGALLLGEVLTPKLLLALAGVALGIWLVNRR